MKKLLTKEDLFKKIDRLVDIVYIAKLAIENEDVKQKIVEEMILSEEEILMIHKQIVLFFEGDEDE